MKRKLGYFFIAIFIALLVLYLFRYKQGLIIEGKVPSAATEVVQIDLRQIEHHLLFDAIKNPLKYISFKTKKKDAPSLKKAIVIPRNLLFFTNTSNLKDAWFSNFVNIKDNTELKSYLLQEGFEASTDGDLELFRKDMVVIGISNNKLLVTYKKKQRIPLSVAIQAVFKETNFYKKDADLLKSISNSKSDISYASIGADFLEADFKKGLFEIKGKIHSELFVADVHPKYSGSSIGFLAAKINRDHTIFKSLITDGNKTKFDEFTKLSVDSITNKWDGNIAFNLKTIDKKIDTIVTYEYDDDFNKIEKKSAQELVMPDLTIALGSQAGLYEYFYNNKAVQIIENDTLFTSFPLYKMYARKQNNGLHIFTQKQFDTSSSKEEQFKLRAHLDINSYLETPLEFSVIPIKNDYFQLLKNASATITTDDELSIQVRMKDTNRNFLGLFIKP